METVMKKCFTDMQALENLLNTFNNSYKDAVKSACEVGKDSRVKMDMTEMAYICHGMLERIKNISASI